MGRQSRRYSLRVEWRLPGELRRWQTSIGPVLITVDRKRDKGELLKEYVANFHPRMIGLRGDKAQTKAVTNAYRIHAMKVIPEGY